MVRPPVLCFLVSIVCVIEMYGDVWLKNNTEDVAMVSITATDNLDHHLNDVLPGQCVFIASDSASINNISYAMKSQRYVTNCGPALTASR